LKILFSATHFGFLRNFQSTIRLLAERGHELHLLAERSDTIDGQKMADILAAEHPAITFERLRPSRHRLWYALAAGIRASLDYWRYLDPRWDQASKLRARACEQAPRLARLVAGTPLIGGRRGLTVLQWVFRRMERAMPPPEEVAEVFQRVRPDILLLTPLLYFGSRQVDQVRCARRLGIKTVLGVGSWDHLTTKGLIHEVPDRVLVWNEAQKGEAVALHGVPADRVLVTGSQAYDHWFAMSPTLDREAFCRQVGLDPARPILLYLCSSPFIAPYEVGFVRKWIAAIRSSANPRLREASILVRPHPQNAKQWEGVDLPAEFAHVGFWPKSGVNPIGGAARADYFDSMYHAEGVIGVNTSAMIESGIIGRPVYSIVTDDFADTQEGTLHFQHLKNVEGGLLHLAPTLDAHLAGLGELLVDAAVDPSPGTPGLPERRNGVPQLRRSLGQSARRFIQAFIRPHGLDVPATPLLVGEIERFGAAAPIAATADSLSARMWRVALAPVAVVATLVTMERAKLRAIALRSTRPFRLIARAAFTRAIYSYRFVRRLPGRLVRASLSAGRYLLVRPVRWAVNRGKLQLHAFLVGRKGGAEAPPYTSSEPDQVP
jgi:hypothetical protein